VALSDNIKPVSQLAADLDSELLEERTPLLSQGMQLVPSASNRFTKDEKAGLYVEVYEPAMTSENPPRVGIIYNVIDRKTNKQVYTSNTVLVNSFAKPPNPVIPVGVPFALDQLQAGQYRLDVIARDANGNASPVHSTNFEVE
jgi:hypothetical protein